jgi:hypothetical protein
MKSKAEQASIVATSDPWLTYNTNEQSVRESQSGKPLNALVPNKKAPCKELFGVEYLYSYAEDPRANVIFRSGGMAPYVFYPAYAFNK